MPKPKRRYTHAGQIEVDIQKARQKSIDLLKSSDAQESHLKERVNSGKMSQEEYAFEMEKVDKLRKTAANLEDKRLPYLKEKLAEFQTMLLPGVTTDESVEA